MLRIEWRSGFGYGDFVTGLGYAHNASIKYQTPVEINFHWSHDLNHKETPEDPETIIDRMWYVYSTMKHLSDVSVNVTTNSTPEWRFINNLDEYNAIHGIWLNNLEMIETDTVVLWRSKYNTFFPGVLKDPIWDKWDNVIDWLTDQGYRVHEVTYRTPVEEVIEAIRVCKFGIGYDGMVHQLFKYLWKPLIVLCERHPLNKLLVPTAALEKDVSNMFENGIDFYLEASYRKIKRVEQHHNLFLSDHKNYNDHSDYMKKISRK